VYPVELESAIRIHQFCAHASRDRTDTLVTMAENQTLAYMARHVLRELTDLSENGHIVDVSERRQNHVIDILDRFKIWANNIGALHGPGNPRSLDHRVRGTPKLQQRFLELLQDIREDMHESQYKKSPTG
jgi:hypothetical protein